MRKDIEIADSVKLKPIDAIAKRLGVGEKYLKHYGKHIAKIDASLLKRLGKRKGKLILVTAITPTKAGEGKTTVSIGLAQAMNKIRKQTTVCLREPSLGPVFGIKGGAAGGGYSQVLPMEDINLHFTGDIHAMGAANNLCSAVIDNHIFQGNKLGIDTNRVLWRRCVDMNDRALRDIRINAGIGGRDESYVITVASEVMAILCLSQDLMELKKRLGNVVVAFNKKGKPVTVRNLGIAGAMAMLLKDAINPNLVQTIEGTPAIIHGGPFANIAHGCSSIIATKISLGLSDYTVTEAGFGSDLGAEKFLDIKCRQGKLTPDAVVLVATIRALRRHGGVENYKKKNLKYVEKGLENLGAHIENIGKFGLPVVVALNEFADDSAEEKRLVKNYCKGMGVKAISVKIFTQGGKGGTELAKEVVKLCKRETQFRFLYGLNKSIKEKIGVIAKEIYGADGVDYTKSAESDIRALTRNGFEKLAICMSKTPLSLSDDGKKLGRPKGFRIKVDEVRVSAGAGFLVAYAGKMNPMPGLGKKPAAMEMDVDGKGKITGLF
ncbi:MAG: formate--tetrahydrofolate ligase [Candidatus Diapherotrites archaeon]